MNFYQALKHVMIGYGARRPHWDAGVLIRQEQNYAEGLVWMGRTPADSWVPVSWPCEESSNIHKILYCLCNEDLTATDWEAI